MSPLTAPNDDTEWTRHVNYHDTEFGRWYERKQPQFVEPTGLRDRLRWTGLTLALALGALMLAISLSADGPPIPSPSHPDMTTRPLAAPPEAKQDRFTITANPEGTP